MNQKKFLPIYFGLFFIVTGLSYFGFNLILPVNSAPPSPVVGDENQVDKPQTGFIKFEGPKTEVCPINGLLYTKQERELWETKRPLLVMIENHADSRPPSGLQSADIVYEAIAEGGITRFMAVYYCGIVAADAPKYDLGPVRSARSYFLDMASEYSDYPLYAHVGGANCSAPKDPVTGRQSGPCTTVKAAQAIEQIADYGWNNKGTWSDLSQFSLPYKACRREPERTGDVRATEHTMYCSSKELWNIAADRGLTNMTEVKKTSWDKYYTPWSFKEKDAPTTSVMTKTIGLDFWGDPKYIVSWTYDQPTNSYLRQNGGKPHIDFNTQKQISAKNIVVQFTKESRSVDEHKHNLYQMVGSGTGVAFLNGTKTDITWSKTTRTSRTVFKDKSGKELNFVPGTVWVEILPIGSDINYDNG